MYLNFVKFMKRVVSVFRRHLYEEFSGRYGLGV